MTMLCPFCGLDGPDLSYHLAVAALVGDCSISREVEMKNRRSTIPPRQGHLVAACGHWCYCYAPSNHVAEISLRTDADFPGFAPGTAPAVTSHAAQKCRKCENAERNAELARGADPTVRHPEGA